MQGIILTGGQGSRLAPLTDNCNKHLLDICGRPMINYSLSMFISASVSDVTLVTNPNHVDDFNKELTSGFGAQFDRFNIVPQKDKPGIAGSIMMMPEESRVGPYMVVLGDNIFGGSVKEYRDAFESDPDNALILLSEVKSPQAFGVARMENNKIIEIVEKPNNNDSHWAITGIYFFPTDLFDITRDVKPSGRGEYEVTEILNYYLKENRLKFRMLEHWWVDAGTHESIAEAKQMICGESGDEEEEE